MMNIHVEIEYQVVSGRNAYEGANQYIDRELKLR